MHRPSIGLVVVVVLGCAAASACGDDDAAPAAPLDASGAPDGSFDAGAEAAAPPDASGGDASDAGAARCDPTSAFGMPVRVDGLSSPSIDWSAGLSEGELVATLVSDRARDAGTGFLDVLTAKRSSPTAPWSSPAVESAFADTSNGAVTVTADGLTMVLERGSPPRLAIARRATTSAPWTAPQPWSESTDGDVMPSLVADGSALYFVRGTNLERAPRTAPGSYGAPSPVAWPTDAREPIRPVVAADELTLYFGNRPSSGSGPYDVWIARRPTVNDPWSGAKLVAEVSTAYADWPTWIAADGCVLYFTSNGTFDDAGGGGPTFDVWMAAR